MRGAVVVLDGERVALIERRVPERDTPYYLFPGGQVEAGETPEGAARREALEELGLQVRIERLLAVSAFLGAAHRYYLATVEGGVFGSGQGEELAAAADHPRGTHTPIWLERAALLDHEVRPRSLAALLVVGLPQAATDALQISD